MEVNQGHSRILNSVSTHDKESISVDGTCVDVSHVLLRTSLILAPLRFYYMEEGIPNPPNQVPMISDRPAVDQNGLSERQDE